MRQHLALGLVAVGMLLFIIAYWLDKQIATEALREFAKNVFGAELKNGPN